MKSLQHYNSTGRELWQPGEFIIFFIKGILMPAFSKNLIRQMFAEAEKCFSPPGIQSESLELQYCSRTARRQFPGIQKTDGGAQTASPLPLPPCAFGKMLSRRASLRLQPAAAKAMISTHAGKGLDFRQQHLCSVFVCGLLGARRLRSPSRIR